MIGGEAGMPTARLCKLIGMPEWTCRRWQAKAKHEQPPKGPWPQPAREAARPLVTKHALAKPEWGHRKIWAMTRHDGHKVSQASVLRLLRDNGLILPAEYRHGATATDVGVGRILESPALKVRCFTACGMRVSDRHGKRSRYCLRAGIAWMTISSPLLKTRTTVSSSRALVSKPRRSSRCGGPSSRGSIQSAHSAACTASSAEMPCFSALAWTFTPRSGPAQPG